MKKHKGKNIFTLGLLLPAALLISSCNGTDNNTSVPDVSSSKEATTFTVTLTKGEGYLLTGLETVRQGMSYAFTIAILDGYEAPNLIVKNNGVAIQGDGHNYLITDVQDNIVITVEGVYKTSRITVATSFYRLNLNKITSEDKSPAKFLEGVEGIYRGEECAVGVNLSEVNFEVEGTYFIHYYLIGHEEITSFATIEIYSLPEIDDAIVDLSYIYSSVVDKDKAGEVHVDFEVEDEEGNVLTGEEIRYNASYSSNHLTASYLKTLPVGVSLSYFAVIEGEKIPFSITITDTEEAMVDYSLEEGTYAYLAADNTSLPTASLKMGSAQKIEFKYYLNDVEVDPQTTTLNAVGDYIYEIATLRNGIENTLLRKTYTFRILNSYELPEGEDLNSGFLFLNANILAKYITGANISYADPVNKTATFSSDKLQISNDLIRIAKAQGYRYLTIGFDVVNNDGNQITSIPFISSGYDGDEIPEFWKQYWNQNSTSGGYSVVELDLDKVDLDVCPTWYLQFGFRTDEGGGYDQMVTGSIHSLNFSSTRSVSKDSWKVTSGEILETEKIGEAKFKVTTKDVSYSWAHVYFDGADVMYAEGYRACIMTVENNNHRAFAYNAEDTSTAMGSWGYGNLIKVGGAATLINLNGDPLVGVMTSHEDVDGNQDEDGTYGTKENLTITIEFLESGDPTTLEDRFYTSEAWESTDANIGFDFISKEVVATGSWSVFLHKAYVDALIEEGYKTINFTIELAKTECYLSYYLNGKIVSIHNDSGVYDLSFVLSSISSSNLQLRANTEFIAEDDDASFHGKGIGCTTTIRNCSLSTEVDPEVEKDMAREKLNGIFLSEGNFWTYFRHNGWGDNTWGPDVNSAIIGKTDNPQTNFSITNTMISTMKIAQYTKLHLHVKAEAVDESQEVAMIYAAVSGDIHQASFFEIQYNGNDVDMVLDFSSLIEEYSESDNIYVSAKDASYEAVGSIFTISAISFE